MPLYVDSIGTVRHYPGPAFCRTPADKPVRPIYWLHDQGEPETVWDDPEPSPAYKSFSRTVMFERKARQTRELIEAAAEAIEVFEEDELEQYAAAYHGPRCPGCHGAERYVLGQLGDVVHFRCRACGLAYYVR